MNNNELVIEVRKVMGKLQDQTDHSGAGFSLSPLAGLKTQILQTTNAWLPGVHEGIRQLKLTAQKNHPVQAHLHAPNNLPLPE